MRILIIEDERRLAQTLADIITGSKDIADICHEGKSGLDSALSGIYDAVIMDVMLPGIGGFEIVRKMRENGSTTPVLMLTAKTELEDRITGLDNGADYYLTKPFQKTELLACIRAITRRGNSIMPEEIIFEDISVNLAVSELVCKNRTVHLGAKELELIRLLIVNKNILLSKESIYLKIWGYDSNTEDNIVEVYISFLRKKLEHIGSKVKIAVVRKIGYRLEAAE